MFIREQLYIRRDIHARLGGQAQGGISTPADHPVILIFTGKQGEEYGYQDGWTKDGVFQYKGEGQYGDMKFIRGNRAIRDHVTDGKELHLFEYVDSGLVRYIGQMVYTGFDRREFPDFNGHMRSVIVFQFLPFDSFDDLINEPYVLDDHFMQTPVAGFRRKAIEEAQDPKPPRESKQSAFFPSSASTDWKGPLPREPSGIVSLKLSKIHFNKGWLFLCGVVVLGALIAFLGNFRGLARPPLTITLTMQQAAAFPVLIPSLTLQRSPTLSATPLAPSRTPTLFFSLTPTGRPSATPLPPSRTPTLSLSLTPALFTPGPLLETPFGPSGLYLVHVVKPGESMESIASRYNTSVEVLLAVNRTDQSTSLWGGTLAVIVVGEKDPTNVRPLKAVWFFGHVLLSELAKQYLIPAEELRTMNGFGPSEWVDGQRYIVIRR